MSKRLSPRLQRTVQVLMCIYGPAVPRSVDAPHNDTPLEQAEAILHELAHQTLLPKEYTFTPGKMASAHTIVHGYLHSLPFAEQDEHEIRAMAIELLVTRRLRMKVKRKELLKYSQENTEIHQPPLCTPKEYGDLVRKSQSSSKVQFHADTIMCLIEEERKKLRYGTLH